MPPHRSALIAVILLANAGIASAQQRDTTTARRATSTAPSTRSIGKAAPSLVSFFAGSWNCDGVFPNGKVIRQTMEFHALLDGAWFAAAHDDALPGTYHAFALWGTADSGRLVANIADNQGGMRRFVAADGYANNRVMFVRDTMFANVGRYGERFTYERQTDSTFLMRYETMRDNVPWHEGDHVVCARSGKPSDHGIL